MPNEVDQIKAALAAWINSQDLSPNYGAAALAEMAGLLVGLYSETIDDVYERYEVMAGLMLAAAKITFRNR